VTDPLDSPPADDVQAAQPPAESGESLRDPERRRAFLATIETWLDELAEPEPPPAGIAPEVLSATDRAPDLYSFLAQLAALTRETQLQGRATNRLHAELGDTLNRLLEQQAAGQDTVAKRRAEARREARMELVTELLEARDRLARGLAEARRRLDTLRGLRARLGQRPVLQALVEGNAMALDRLDDTLRRLDVHEIPAQGKPFDPRVMRAVEVADAPASPPGTVLDVFRAGYTADGRVLRFVEVKVAGGTTPAAGESDG
jgi:molecular chaperone GrpE